MLSTSNTAKLRNPPSNPSATSVFNSVHLRKLIAQRPKTDTSITYETLIDILEAYIFCPKKLVGDQRYCVCCNQILLKSAWTAHKLSRVHIKRVELWEMKMKKITDILQSQFDADIGTPQASDGEESGSDP